MALQGLWHLLQSCVAPNIDHANAVSDLRPLPEDRDLAGQIEKAAGEVLSSIGIRARLLDRDHLLKIARGLNDRAVLEKEEGRTQLAKALCLRALDIFEKTVVPDHPQLAEVLENYAAILHQEAALVEARAAAIRDNRLGEISRELDTRIQK